MAQWLEVLDRLNIAFLLVTSAVATPRSVHNKRTIYAQRNIVVVAHLSGSICHKRPVFLARLLLELHVR